MLVEFEWKYWKYLWLDGFVWECVCKYCKCDTLYFTYVVMVVSKNIESIIVLYMDKKGG